MIERMQFSKEYPRYWFRTRRFFNSHEEGHPNSLHEVEVGCPNKRNGSPKFLVSQIEDLEYVRYHNHKPN